jgi:cell division protein FtsZ
MQFDPNHIELPLTHEVTPDRSIVIKIVGVGGAGSNAIDRLKMDNLEGLQLAVVNTDQQALSGSPIQDKVLLGSKVTRGLGTGGDPDLGRQAAETDREKIAALAKGCDLVFLLAGLGGGTGGGASPIIADVATKEGALVIAFVTMPFSFEGGRRLKQAEESLLALRRVCDAVIPISNDVLLQECTETTGVKAAFALADAWIGRGVKSIWSMLFRTGLINLDFATLQQVFQSRGGKTLFSLGSGEGPQAVTQVVESLKLCPLMQMTEFSRKPDRLLVNIVGGSGLTLPMVNELMTAITEQYGRESHVIMGAVIDESMQQRLEVCVVGTTDVGSRSQPPWRLRAAARSAQAAPGKDVTENPAITPAVASGTAAEPLPEAKTEQNEFSFGEVESRGHFDKTDRNLFDGQDLDIPTYLRKGIKIAI